ncbi:SCO2522 family protein [Yinghuangia sp. ASG 101]|uniref:SCO2522 family protein n=1 Tax=Yinghuangia sp. ASG 101 TaxID=2896848 RepID=UPI001E3FC1E2|nr:SCO2522 family protein [Yinghuangia sp. ASG 101]UGQ10813.1 SCO2522 family protein [Yinghuangia sp. ASG 101]
MTVDRHRTDAATVFREQSAQDWSASVPLAHTSVELGHLYMEDFAAGPDRLREHFAAIAPWAETARAVAAPPGRRARVSTCFLVDDYFTRLASPAELIPELVAAARESGVEIDYLGRESGCARAGDVSPAALLASRLVPSPPEGGNGARPPTDVSGWMCNGTRSPVPVGAEAMAPPPDWRPPREFGARRHSVFLDVELWDGDGEHRTWSCPFLAAVWQLLRLGLLRDRGAAVASPVPWSAPDFPDDWDDLPAVIRLNPSAAPFTAYRTFSVMGTRFLPIEHAVRVVLGHTAIDAAVRDRIAARAAAEGVPLPPDLPGRVNYALVADRFAATDGQGTGGGR